MCKHLTVYVKARLLQEFINKLDAKGWSVIDVEPTTTYHPYIWSLVAPFILSIFLWNGIYKNIIEFAVMYYIILGVVTIASLVASSVKKVYDYTVVCEYVGDPHRIDITPFDDTDDNFESIDDEVQPQNEEGTSN